MTTKQMPRIEVEKRDRIGSRYAARLREKGRLPVVIYGHRQDPVHACVDYKQMVGLLHANTHLIEAVVEAQNQPVLIRDVQWDHLGAKVVHVDLTRVDLTERVTVKVKLDFVGEALGLKETAGAILEHPITEIEVECLVTEIPESIKVDVSALKVGDAITGADLKLPPNVTCKLTEDNVIAAVNIVAEMKEPEPAAVEEAAEPKVIGKKTEEEEAAAAAEGGAKGAAPAKGGAPAKEAAPAKGDKKK